MSQKQVDILPRGLRNHSCIRHSLRHGKAIIPVNPQLHRTPPSLRASSFYDWASCCWGFTVSRGDQFISDPSLSACILSPKQTSWLISGKCPFYLTNPNPNFSYKIGIFAWQFACRVVSSFLLRNRKYQDLGYYSGIRAVFLANYGLKR